MADALYTAPVHLVGVNHRSLGVAGRERLAALIDDRPESLRSLLTQCELTQGAVLSTCNRFEVVGVADNDRRDRIQEILSKELGGSLSDGSCYALINDDAVRHLFRVAGSLDSMVIGEAQILGQVKRAYQASVSAGYAGSVLHKLFQSAFSTAKRIRSHTGLAREGVSISYVAVQLAKQIFGELKGVSVLVLGSGEMAELALLHLKAQGCAKIIVANRTTQKAMELAERLSGTAIPLGEVTQVLPEVDVVIGSLRIDEPLLPVATVRALKRTRPLFLIDLGLPRNFTPGLDELDDVYLYNLDDLQAVATANRELREEAALDAELIVDHGVFEFERWLTKISANPAIVDFRSKVLFACQTEAVRVLGIHATQDQIDRLAYGISQKVSHEFSELLAQSAGGKLSPEALWALAFAPPEESDDHQE